MKHALLFLVFLVSASAAYSQALIANPPQVHFYFGTSTDNHAFDLTSDERVYTGHFACTTNVSGAMNSDILIYNYETGALRIEKNIDSSRVINPASNYTSMTPNSVADHADIYVGNFDGDAYDDILIFDRDNGQLWIKRNPAAGTQIAPKYIGVLNGTYSLWRLFLGNFGGDGKDDIVCYSTHASYYTKIYVGIITTNGSNEPVFTGGVTQWNTTYTLTTHDYDFYVANFDNNGYDDLFVHDKSTSTNNFHGFFSDGTDMHTHVMTSYSSSSDWRFTVSDYTGTSDGDELIGYRKSSDGKIYIGKPTTSSFPALIQIGLIDDYTDDKTGATATITATDNVRLYSGEFSGNTKTDIVIYDVTDNLIYMGYNYLSGTYPTTDDATTIKINRWSNLTNTNNTTAAISPNFNGTDVKLQVGEFDGNGRLDILVNGVSSDGYSASIGSNFMPPLGYCYPQSLSIGETLHICTQGYSKASKVTINNYYRTHYWLKVIPAGGAQSMAGIVQDVTISNNSQYFPPDGWKNGYDWTSTDYTIPTGWPSGYYLARLKSDESYDKNLADDSQDQLIPFIIKPASNPAPGQTGHSDVALIANTNTWQAYNLGYKLTHWGYSDPLAGYQEGLCKYSATTDHTFSFKRPMNSSLNIPSGGDGTFATEVYAFTWLAVSGIQPHVFSDMDLHNNVINTYGNYKVIVLSTHPEYWDTTMYDNLKTFLDGGGDLLYIAGNGIFEKVYSMDADKIVFYSGAATSWEATPNATRAKYLFRNNKNASGTAYTYSQFRPEISLLGLHTDDKPVPKRPYMLVVDPNNPPDFLVNDVLGTSVSNDSVGNFNYIMSGKASGGEIDNANVIDRYVGGTFANGANDYKTTNMGCGLNQYSQTLRNWDTLANRKNNLLNFSILATADHSNPTSNFTNNGTAYISRGHLVYHKHNANSHVLSAGSIIFPGSLMWSCSLTDIVRAFLSDSCGVTLGSSLLPAIGGGAPLDNPTNCNASGGIFQRPAPTTLLSDIVVYPNPMNDELIISIPEKTIVESFSMTNISGQAVPVLIKSKDEREIRLNTSNYANGIYMLNLKTNKGPHIQLILK